MSPKEEKKFYAGFKKTVDLMPAVCFAQEFSRLFESAAKKKFGLVIPNDRRALVTLSMEVIEGMRIELAERDGSTREGGGWRVGKKERDGRRNEKLCRGEGDA